ncbi:MAG: acyl-CoA synthetase FdrA [Rudaea sp.]
MVVRALVKRGEYRDSVALMLLAGDLKSSLDLIDASATMATPANKAILSQAGLVGPEAETAGPNDLLIAVRARDQAAADQAIRRAEQLLARPSGPTGPSDAAYRPRSVRSAARMAPAANLAVISVPGEYAAAQAWDALRAGLHVLLFSDHVALEDEIALKGYAREHGLLVMGPGAGTAIINGIGLGFANDVPRGPVGIVAAAGTGLQEASTLLAQAGVGISQAIGVGGRDVSEAVGGVMMLEGLRALHADPETRVLLIVSKLPDPSVLEKVVHQARQLTKPVVLAIMGASSQPDSPPGVFFASDLREAAAVASALATGKSVKAARRRLQEEDRAIRARGRSLRRRLTSRQRYLRGLYSGGTLCEETMRLWQEPLGPIWSNAPLDPRYRLPDSTKSKRHTVIDLGEEEFTIGRPHPMIDNSERVRRLLQEARDPSVAAIVLDVVLGYGAHRDPASELGPAIAEAKAIASKRGRQLIFIASVTGTEGDPQGLPRQRDALKKAGAIVMASNAAAARLARDIIGM